MEHRRKAGQGPARGNQRQPMTWNLVKRDWAWNVVKKIQRKIYRETRASNFREVNHLQDLLVKKFAARYIAVWTVTERNNGRNTPGIDGKLYTSNADKMDLVESLQLKDYGVKYKLFFFLTDIPMINYIRGDTYKSIFKTLQEREIGLTTPLLHKEVKE